MVATETSELVARRGPAPFKVPQMKGVHATYLFEIEEGESWRLRIDDGMAQIQEGAAEADCIIRAADHDIALVLTGRQNLLTALLQGRVTVRGDMALAQRFHGALPRGSNQRRAQ